jgi:hypothetical protein
MKGSLIEYWRWRRERYLCNWSRGVEHSRIRVFDDWEAEWCAVFAQGAEKFEQLGDIWRGVVHRAEMRDYDGWN